MYAHWLTRRPGIEPAHVAGRIMKIHEPMDRAHHRKRFIDCSVQTRFISALYGDFHERPKEGTSAPDFT
jgi:hypothetical protein